MTTDWAMINCIWQDCVIWFGCHTYVQYPEALLKASNEFADDRTLILEAYELAGYDLIQVASIGLNAMAEPAFMSSECV